MTDPVAEARRALEQAVRDFGEAAMTFADKSLEPTLAFLVASKKAQAAFVRAMALADAYAKERALAVLAEADPRGRTGKLGAGWTWDLYFGHLDALRDRLEKGEG